MNRFIENKKRIKVLCEVLGVDVSTATSIFAKETGMSDYTKELVEFNAILIEYQKHPIKTLADFFTE